MKSERYCRGTYARRIVAASTSLNPIPPIFPSLTYSARTLMVCSTGKAGSCRAHSKMSSFFLPSSRRRHSSTLRRMFSSEPSTASSPFFKPPLTLRTTLSAFSGYLVKYLLSRCRELYSGVPYSSPAFQKLAPSSRVVLSVSKHTSCDGGCAFQVIPDLWLAKCRPIVVFGGNRTHRAIANGTDFLSK